MTFRRDVFRSAQDHPFAERKATLISRQRLSNVHARAFRAPFSEGWVVDRRVQRRVAGWGAAMTVRSRCRLTARIACALRRIVFHLNSRKFTRVQADRIPELARRAKPAHKVPVAAIEGDRAIRTAADQKGVVWPSMHGALRFPGRIAHAPRMTTEAHQPAQHQSDTVIGHDSRPLVSETVSEIGRRDVPT